MDSREKVRVSTYLFWSNFVIIIFLFSIIIKRIFAHGLFVSKLSLVLIVWLYQLGLKNKVNPHLC